MKVLTVTMPAFLASALINGDLTGLEDADLKWVDVAHKYCAPGRIVSCDGEPFFAHWNELPGFELATNCLEYTVLYQDGEV